MANFNPKRFEEALGSLDLCKDELEKIYVYGKGKLSNEELKAARCLVTVCAEVCAMALEHAGLDEEDLNDLVTRDEPYFVLDKANDMAEEG